MIPGSWRRDTTAVIHDDDTSSSLVYVPVDRLATFRNNSPPSNRRPDWWKPPQLRREKRPLAVRLWQSERRASKKTARTNERRERKSRA